MKLICKSALATTLVIGIVFLNPASAEWSADPAVRTPVVTAEYGQGFPRLVRVHGGFVVTWDDMRREATHRDVYAQKFSINGEMLWPENGRVVAAGPENSLVYQFQVSAGLVRDGDGGVLVGWNDASDVGYYQAFASKVTADTTVSWGNPGELIQASDTAIPLMAHPNTGLNRLPEYSADKVMVADSEKGAFFALNYGVGRVDANGGLRTNWIYDSSDVQIFTTMVPVVEFGEKDGVFIVWSQGNSYLSDGIYTRKLVDPETSWPAQADTLIDRWGRLNVFQPGNVVRVCNLKAVTDGDGGVILVWTDGRVVIDGVLHVRVYAQRIDADGNLMWGEEGVQVSETMNYDCGWRNSMFAAPDGDGGVVIAWNNILDRTQRAQRLTADGSTHWVNGGVIVDTQINTYYVLTTHGLVHASDNNFIVLYRQRDDDLLITQKLDASSGEAMWDEGQVVLDNCFVQHADKAQMVSDGRAGAVVAWEACDGNIYAHRVVETSTGWDVIFKNGFE